MTRSNPSEEIIAWPDGDKLLELSGTPQITDEHRAIAVLTGNVEDPYSNLGMVRLFLQRIKFHPDRAKLSEENSYGISIPINLDVIYYGDYSDPGGYEEFYKLAKKIRRGALDNIYDFYHADRIHSQQIEVTTKTGNRAECTLYSADDGLIFAERGLWYDRERQGEPDKLELVLYRSFDDEDIMSWIVMAEEGRLETLAA